MGIFPRPCADCTSAERRDGGSVSRYVFKLPDLGEGTVEAEIVGWRVKPGDVVSEDDVIVEVMTDKAAVEVPAPVAGKVISVTGTPGDMVPVGAELIVFETDAGAGAAAPTPNPTPTQVRDEVSHASQPAASPPVASPVARTNGSGNGHA